MIELRVIRVSPDNTEKPVTAYYDDVHGHWLCEDKDFYLVLRNIDEPPEIYTPDEALSIVRYVANLYHGQIIDHRPKSTEPAPEGRVY